MSQLEPVDGIEVSLTDGLLDHRPVNTGRNEPGAHPSETVSVNHSPKPKRIRTEGHRIQKLASMKRLRESRIAAGLCPICGHPPAAGKQLCTPCQIQRRINTRKHRGRNRGRLYGLNEKAYSTLLACQHSRCAICNITLTSEGTKPTKPHIDHDHSTHRVRGILCQNCNLGLGSFKDNPDRLRQAAAYLEMPSSCAAALT